MASATNVSRIQMESEDHLKSKSHWQRAFSRLKKDYLTLIALGFIGMLAVLTIMAEPISKTVLHTTYATENLKNIFAAPTWDLNNHPLGTDEKGRDHLSRLLHGGQISLRIAFFAAMLSLTIGVSLGMITGYYGGIVDD